MQHLLAHYSVLHNAILLSKVGSRTYSHPKFGERLAIAMPGKKGS
jgi:hypothetical protein